MSDKKPTQVIKSDLVDQMLFNDLHEESSKISELSKTSELKALNQDIFSSLYKLRPEVQPDAPNPQRELIQQMMNLPEYKKLTSDTRMDDIASGMGLMTLAPPVMEQFKKVQEKIEEKRKEHEEKYGPDSPDNPNSFGSDPKNGTFESLSSEEQSEIRAAFRAALRASQEEVEDGKKLLGGWGIEPGELQRMPLGKKLELMEKLRSTPKYARIADIAGRFRNVHNATIATTTKHGQDEIVDITVGSDLARILPSEMIKFQVSPELFYKDMVEGSLLQYEMKGTEHIGRGPIIMMGDISGSMMYGGREEWCKGAVLTLMEICRKQKRAFGYIAFEARVKWAEYWTKGRQPTAQDKLDIAQIQSNGGTNFMEPLRAAFRFREQDKDLKPADFVMVTDGECNFSKDDLKWITEQKKIHNVRIFGVAVASGSLNTLRLFCDEVVQLTHQGDVLKLEEADQMIRAVTAR